MPEAGIRNHYSQCPFQILMCDDNGILGSGTAFFFEYDDESFLITNWHNFSFRHFIDKTPLGSSARFPNHMKVKLVTALNDGTSATTVAQRIEIYDAYGPKWYEHPEHGSGCDVIALPLARPETCALHFHEPANKLDSARVPVAPGVTAFIIGFPRTISVGPGLPLWKSGYIASEPHYNVRIGGKISLVGGLSDGLSLPAFFIDSQTREGMSGAPVFAAYTGIWNTTDPFSSADESGSMQLSDDTAIGSAAEFVGCYSGRVGPNEEGAALGLCWRVCESDTIEAICSARVRGQIVRRETVLLSALTRAKVPRRRQQSEMSH